MTRHRRPSKFSRPKFQLVLDRIREGETIEQVCDDPSMPLRLTLYDWLRAEPANRTRFDEALEDRNTTWKDKAVGMYARLMERLQAGEDIPKDEVTSAKAFAQFLSGQAARTERSALPAKRAAASGKGSQVTVEIMTYNDMPSTTALDDLEDPPPSSFDDDEGFEDEEPEID